MLNNQRKDWFLKEGKKQNFMSNLKILIKMTMLKFPKET